MLEADFASSFARDRKRCGKKHRDIAALDAAIRVVLESDETDIPDRYNDHSLAGNWDGYRELHIGGRNTDWLMIYKLGEGIVGFTRTGSHDELFK